MKPLLLTLFLAASSALFASEPIVGGPKGGRLLEAEGLKVEFFVTAEKKAEVIFYDAALRPVAPEGRVATVTTEAPAGRAALELEKTATGYLSRAPLPAGEPYRVVVQLRASPGAKPHIFRIDLELATCGECRRAEYACTCGH